MKSKARTPRNETAHAKAETVGGEAATGCELAQLRSELRSQVGLVLDRLEQHGNRLEVWRLDVAAQVADVRDRQTKGDQREERYLEELGRVTRAMAQASVRAVREELSPIVHAEVDRQLVARLGTGEGA